MKPRSWSRNFIEWLSSLNYDYSSTKTALTKQLKQAEILGIVPKETLQELTTLLHGYLKKAGLKGLSEKLNGVKSAKQ